MAGGEAFGGIVIDLFPELVEEVVDVLEELAKRFAAAEIEPGEAGFKVGHLFEVTGPGLVDRVEADGPFGLIGLVPALFEDLLAGLQKRMALPFDDAFVFVEK